MSSGILRQGQRMAVKLHVKNYGGYSYYSYRSRNETSYLRCYDRNGGGCPAIGKIVNGEPLLTINHNHDRNPLLCGQNDFQKALYKATINRPFQSMRLIYDHLSQLHSVAATSLTWVKMQPAMQRWRSKVRPQHPANSRDLMEYAEQLQLPQWQHLIRYNNGELNVHTIPVTDGSFVTVISDVNFLGLLNPTTFFMDATFKITPRKPKVYQVFSIMGLVDDTALPICWMLMTAKSSSAYSAGLTYFKDVLAPHIQPQTFITDFEISLRNSILFTFPQAKHVGCLFHYCQALMRKFKKFNLLQLCKEWIPGQIIIRKFMALALLPHQDIPAGFDWLVTNLPADIRRIFDPFIAYYRRQWLIRETPARYSVYNEKHRSNNYSEASNRRNKLRFGIHPSIWTFTEKLRDLQAVTHLELLSLFRGEPVIREPRSQTLKRDEDINNAWILYEQNILNIQSFLAYASFFLKPAYQEEEQNLNNMDIVTDEEEDVLEVGGVILQPPEYYYAMEVFHEIDVVFE
ncbi:uncharacterized protein LOC123270971 [Cotesia glomerata]|uniref:uncharacterized protein LOC123270971 n=1 Tax=Cotesia glomerata TaxID=32391 RepID=UPI001D00A73F|nr:uncharacterized protein LOC123270971 [Cotesia glomerata]